QALAEAVAAPPDQGSGGGTVFGSFALAPPFDGSYLATDLGAPPGLPPAFGGLTMLDYHTLLVRRASDSAAPRPYIVPLVRDEAGPSVAFGQAFPVGDVPYVGGNLVFGPGGVVFFPRWPIHEIGQLIPGSGVIDKSIPMAPFGAASSVDGLNFVPPGFPGEG